MNNKKLNNAKRVKDDEFYTPYEQFECWLKICLLDKLENKIIYCPCDAEWSNFPKYFKEHKELGYKDIWNTSDDFHTHTDLFEQCDIIITNPPFSIIRDWLDFIAKFNKKVIYVCPPTHAAYAFSAHRYYYTLIPGQEYYLNLDGIKLEDEMRRGNKTESLYGTSNMLWRDSNGILKIITNLRGTNITLDKDLRGGIAITTNLRGNKDYDLTAQQKDGPGYRFDHIKNVRIICNLRCTEYDVMPSNSEHKRDIMFTVSNKNLLNVDKVITKSKYLKDIQEEYYDEYRYRGHKVLNVNKLRDLPRDYFGYFGLPTTAIGSRNELNDMIDYIELIKKPVVNGKSKFQRFLCKWKNWEEPEEIS